MLSASKFQQDSELCSYLLSYLCSYCLSRDPKSIRTWHLQEMGEFIAAGIRVPASIVSGAIQDAREPRIFLTRFGTENGPLQRTENFRPIQLPSLTSLKS
jgi:hypothetical protein